MSVVGFFPQGQFALPRSYLHGLVLSTDHDFASLVGDVIIAGYASIPDFTAFIFLDSRFIPWTSNRWTLDHIVTSAFYCYPCPDTIHDYSVIVNWEPAPYPAMQKIHIVNAGSSLYTYFFDLPSGPDDYWAAIG